MPWHGRPGTVRWLLLLLLLPLGCPEADTPPTVLGAGSAATVRLMADMLLTYRVVQPNLSIAYTGLTSPRGLCRIMSAERYCDAADTAAPLSIDFAMTDALVPTTQQYAEVPDLQLYPLMAASVVPIFNLGVARPLVLSMPVLAGIFQGTVTRWDDPNITALNPTFPTWGVPAGQPIEVVVRKDASGTSQLFRQALGGYDPAFANVTGAVDGMAWGTARPTAIETNQLLMAYVMATRYTIGYSFAGEAQSVGLGVAQLRRDNGAVLAATTEAVEYAVLELGGLFGLDGTDPSRLTANLCNAVNPLAWPIVGYSYVALRKRTLRDGATCESVRALLQFLKWFLASDVTPAVMERRAFSPLPALLATVVARRLDSDVRCNNETVAQEGSSLPLAGAGPAPVTEAMRSLLDVYSAVEGVSLTLNTTSDSSAFDADEGLSRFPFLLSATQPSGLKTGYSMPLAGMGLVAISQISVVLDAATLARILDGNVTRWLDPAIRTLNPAGVSTAGGVPVTDGSQRITLLRGPVATSATLGSLLGASYPPYSGQALRSAAVFPTETALQSALLAFPYSLSVTTLGGIVPDGLALIPLRRSDGSIVAPSTPAVAACAAPELFDSATGTISLQTSTATACYPLVAPVYLVLQPMGCVSTGTDGRTQAMQLAQWLCRPATQAVLAAAGLAPLNSLPPVAAYNTQVLSALSCSSSPSVGSRSDVLPLAAGVGAGVPALVLAVAGLFYCGLRRGRRDVRRAPKDPKQPFCVLFTDIEGSTAMWAKVPVEMAAALEAHHRIIRGLVEQFKLYEVKTIGDSFMCVTLDARQAVDFALELQTQFYAHDWGTTVLDDVYCAMEKVHAEQAKGAHAAELWGHNPACWNGLRVRVGLHCGVGDIKFDPVAKGYDYYGTVVNTAARIVEICHGGQVTLSEAVKDELPPDYAKGIWLDMGPQPLKGLPDPVRLLQVLPAGPLARRQFPALRHVNVSSEGTTDFSSSDVASRLMSSACFSPDSHPLVVHGLVSGTDLHTRYMHAVSTLRVLLSTQTPNFRNQVLTGLCGRLKVRHVGNTGSQLQLTLHRIVLRILPALALNTEPLVEELASESGFGSLITPAHITRNRSYNSESQEVGGMFMPVIPTGSLPGQMDVEEGMAVRSMTLTENPFRIV
eukprot:EG_transcript_418